MKFSSVIFQFAPTDMKSPYLWLAEKAEKPSWRIVPVSEYLLL